MEYQNGDYSISDDREAVQLEKVAALLKTSYWANERDLETIQTSINNSICFSLFHHQEQVGFARVVTDMASVAYIADVIIAPSHRGKGLGKWLVETVVTDPRWSNRFQFLATDDAHSLYERHGFSGSHKLMSTKI
jgi:GNAT superfamily N-acetyltransferase